MIYLAALSQEFGESRICFSIRMSLPSTFLSSNPQPRVVPLLAPFSMLSIIFFPPANSHLFFNTQVRRHLLQEALLDSPGCAGVPPLNPITLSAHPVIVFVTV